ALHVVLQEHGNMREDGFQFAGELFELEFMHVKRVDALRAARLGIEELVGRTDNQPAVRSKHAARLLKKAAPVFQMFDNFEGDYQVEPAIGIGQLRARRSLETQIE